MPFTPGLTPGFALRILGPLFSSRRKTPPGTMLQYHKYFEYCLVPAMLELKVAEYVPDPHPAYPYLHLAHRADYLRLPAMLGSGGALPLHSKNGSLCLCQFQYWHDNS